MAMGFWGIEVPPGKGKEVEVLEEEHLYIHVSQASLGPNAVDQERVFIQVEADGNSPIVLGTLVKSRCDQMQLDLVFDKKFRIFHNSKSSIFIAGYQTKHEDDDEEDYLDYEDDEDDEEEEEGDEQVPEAVPFSENGTGGKPSSSIAVKKGKEANGKLTAAAPAVTFTEPEAEEGEEDEDDDDFEGEDDDEEDEDDFEGLDAEEDMMEGDEEDEDEDEDDAGEDEDDEGEDDEEEEVKEEKKPVQPKVGAKRAAETEPKAGKPVKNAKAAQNGPAAGAPGKKAKPVASPDAGKEKGAKLPEKKAEPGGKTKNAAKSSPDPSSSNFFCKPCNKSFSKEDGFNQHNKAKHS